MLKTVLAGAAALAIAGSSIVYAQQRMQDGTSPDVVRHWRPSQDDINAFTDARVAALKAGLKLTADQEKNWPAFEQAYRDMAKFRAERMRERFERRDHARTENQSQPAGNQAAATQPTENINPIERMQRAAANMTARGAALKKLADAAGPLYQSLDDGQKQRFLLLSRPMGPRHHEHFAFWRMHRGEGPEQQ